MERTGKMRLSDSVYLIAPQLFVSTHSGYFQSCIGIFCYCRNLVRLGTSPISPAAQAWPIHLNKASSQGLDRLLSIVSREDCKRKNVTIVVSLYLSHLLLAFEHHADGFSIPDPAKLGYASVRVSRGHSAPGRCGRSGSTGV